jgi:hypothetical protein
MRQGARFRNVALTVAGLTAAASLGYRLLAPGRPAAENALPPGGGAGGNGALGCATRRTLAIESRSQSTLAAESKTGRSLDITYELTVQEVALAAAEGEMLVHFTLLRNGPETKASGDRRAVFDPAARSLYAHYDGLGTLAGFYVESGASPQAFDALKLALTPWQYSRSGQPLYDVVEPDALGLAAYRYHVKDGGIRKTKLSFPRLWRGNVRPRVERSEGELELEQSGRLGALRYAEETRIDAPGAEVKTATSWKGRTTVTEERTAEERRDCEQATVAKAIQKLGLVSIGLEPRALAAARRTPERSEEIEQATVEERLAKLPPESDLSKRQHALFVLTQHLTLEPRKIPLVEAAVLDRLDRPEDAQSLIGVLAVVDHEEAQAALLRLMKALASSREDKLLIFAMRQHLFSEHPIAANVDYMLDVAAASSDVDGIKLPAILAATAAGSKLAAGERGALIERLEKDFSPAEGDALEEPMLAALGNLGDHRVFATLVSRAMRRDPELAEAAVEAMAAIPGEDVERFLLSIASSQAKTVAMRKAALTAMIERTVTARTLQGLVELYPELADTALRQACLEIIVSENNRHWPRARALRCELRAASTLTEQERAFLGRDPC